MSRRQSTLIGETPHLAETVAPLGRAGGNPSIARWAWGRVLTMQASVRFSIAKQRVAIAEPVRVSVRVSNAGTEPLLVQPAPIEVRFFVDGTEADWRQHAAAAPMTTTLRPGHDFEFVEEHELSVAPSAMSGLVVLALRVEVVLVLGGVPERFTSGDLEVELDARGARPLSTPAGVASRYIIGGTHVFYVSGAARAREPRVTTVTQDVMGARVLDAHYLVDSKRVYRDGRLRRGVSPVGFRVLNSIFAGNPHVILSSYGDAKVDDPATFEVLDAAEHYWMAQRPGGGYRAGFGRDQRFVYYFDESTSSTAAIRMKACKRPATFVVLDHLFARDDEHVYRESTRIKGADPRSFRVLNRMYARDARRAYFATDRLDGIDLDSFEVAPDPHTGEPRDSEWARDAGGYLHFRDRATEASYRLACDEAARRRAAPRRL